MTILLTLIVINFEILPISLAINGRQGSPLITYQFFGTKNMNHLLIVDDDADIRATLKELGEDAGYHCTEAGDGVEALKLIKQKRADLVFLDIHMPGVDGIQLVDRFLAQFHNECPPIILISGYTNTLPPIIHPRVHEVISKPFDTKKIESILQTYHNKKEIKEMKRAS